MSELDLLRKKVKEKAAIIGKERTLKMLKLGKLSKVMVAANVSKDTKEDVLHYAGVEGVDVSVLKISNEELGVLCRKPFSISVIGLKNEN